MASLVLGNIGSAFLGPVGGFLGSAVGSYVDNLLFAPTPADVEGPRLTDLKGIQADPGQPIALVYGADRIAGTVVHTTDLIETKHKKRQGGKGGGKKQTQITYTYHIDIDYMLCEGPILGVGRIWTDGKLVRGTRYQMELDTDENFEQVGGIPYQSWYKDHIYKPDEIPWSWDQDITPTIGNQLYVWNIRNGFQEVTDEQAEIFLDTKRVVYRYDAGSDKMLPIERSHGYTGEIIAEADLEPIRQIVRSAPPSLNFGGFGAVSESVDQDGTFLNFEIDISELVPDQLSGPTEELMGYASVTFELSGSNNPGVTEPFLVTSSASLRGFYRDPVTGIEAGFADSSGVSTGRVVTNTNDVVAYSVTIPLYLGYNVVAGSVTGARTVPAFTRSGSVSGVELVAEFFTPQSDPEIRDWPDYFNFFDAINDFSPRSVLEFHGPEGVALYRGTKDQLPDPTMELVAPDGLGAVPAYRGRAHIVFQRFELADFGNRIPNLTFEVVQSDDARIRPVIENLMDRAGIEPEYYDISQLPEAGVPSYVLGYSIGTLTSYRAAMEPLLEAFQIDAAEIGNQIVFRPKRRNFDHEVEYPEIQAIDAGSNPETPIKITLRDVIDMPRSLGIRYRDPEREYQQNTATFTRQVTPSRGNSVIELPAVLSPSVMKEFVRDKMRDVWLERNSGAFTLPHRYVHFSPSDIIRINGEEYGREDVVFKLTSVTRRDTGIIELEGVLRETTLYIPEEGETSNNQPDRTIFNGQRRPLFSITSKLFTMNLPALLPTHDDAGFYYSVSGSRNAWSGASLYLNRGTTLFPNWVLQESLFIGARSGSTRGTYLNAVASPQVVDYNSELFVFLHNKDEELESITGEELFNGGNAALVGDEIVHFRDAEKQTNGSYRLSIFLRGRRGTERFSEVGGPASNPSNRFLLLDRNELNNISRTVDEANNPTLLTSPTEYYQPLAFGASESDLFNNLGEPFENRLQRLIPFAPVQLTSRRLDNGDIKISWRRQDRMVFTMTSAAGDARLSESVEEYSLSLEVAPRSFDAQGQLIEPTVRSVTITEDTEFLYTSNMQAEDGVTTSSHIPYTVSQISTNVGKGQAAQGVLNVR